MEGKIYNKKIRSILSFAKLIVKVEKDSESQFELERQILQKFFPNIITRKEGYEKLRKKLPFEITIDKNKTYNKGRITINDIN